MSQKSPEDDRKARLAQALRENLKRRKSQARLRASPAEAPAGKGEDAARPSDASAPLLPQDRPPQN